MKKMYYKDDFGFLLSPLNNKGDALWQTSLALIAYNDPDFKKAIRSCFALKFDNRGAYLQASRYMGQREDDVSRDQIIMAIVALKITNYHVEADFIVKSLRYRISKKFTMVPDMWLFLHGYKWLFYFSSFYVLFGCIWNKTLDLFIDWSVPSATVKKWRKRRFVEYAFHLHAWMSYTLGLKMTLLVKFAPKYNLLLKILYGSKVTEKEMSDYKPTSGYLWQRRLDYTNNMYHGYKFLDKETIESQKYLLERDILLTIYEKEGLCKAL